MKKRSSFFSGHAIATQGDKIIKADRLILHYKNNPEKPQKPEIKGMGTAGDLDQVEAEGHVTITQTHRVVTGDHAIFYQDTQKIIMTGNAVMRDGKMSSEETGLSFFLMKTGASLRVTKRRG